MDINTLRIVYMGTPDFAVAPLDRLLVSGCNVVAAVTAPDRPAGRGKKVRQSAVKKHLLQHYPDIPILQPDNLKEPEFVNKLRELKPDLQVVVAFRMLPELVWGIPHKGTFNLHASLLPQYRGAAPINHAIINGETETGVTTFMIDEKIDTGNILLQEKTAIGQQETAGELHDRLMEMGASLVLETVSRLTTNKLETRSQDSFQNQESNLKKAPKIYRDNCRINWDRSGIEIFNLIRGLSPYPGAFTLLSRNEDETVDERSEKVQCKVFSASFNKTSHHESPGTISTDGKKYLEVSVKDGQIKITSIQQEGKRRMDIRDFLAGIKLTSETCRFS